MSTESPRQTPATPPALRPLTAREEAFARRIAAGDTLSDAYAAAFKPSRSSRSTIHTEAKRAAKRPWVKLRVTQLLTKSEAKTILAINDRLAIAARIAQDPLQKPSDQLTAIKIYTDIAKDTAPDRSEVTVKGDPDAPVVTRRLTPAEVIANLRAAKARRDQPPAP